MLRHSDEAQGDGRPEFRALLDQLAADGQSWAEAEIALAKLEWSELRRQALRALFLAMLGLSAVFASLVALSQAGIAFLAPYVGGAGVAALIIGVCLLLLSGMSMLAVRRGFNWRAQSILFRWLGRKPFSEPPS